MRRAAVAFAAFMAMAPAATFTIRAFMWLVIAATAPIYGHAVPPLF